MRCLLISGFNSFVRVPALELAADEESRERRNVMKGSHNWRAADAGMIRGLIGADNILLILEGYQLRANSVCYFSSFIWTDSRFCYREKVFLSPQDEAC